MLTELASSVVSLYELGGLTSVFNSMWLRETSTTGLAASNETLPAGTDVWLQACVSFR